MAVKGFHLFPGDMHQERCIPIHRTGVRPAYDGIVVSLDYSIASFSSQWTRLPRRQILNRPTHAFRNRRLRIRLESSVGLEWQGDITPTGSAPCKQRRLKGLGDSFHKRIYRVRASMSFQSYWRC
jgi:hypothetical protein